MYMTNYDEEIRWRIIPSRRSFLAWISSRSGEIKKRVVIGRNCQKIGKKVPRIRVYLQFPGTFYIQWEVSRSEQLRSFDAWDLFFDLKFWGESMCAECEIYTSSTFCSTCSAALLVFSEAALTASPADSWKKMKNSRGNWTGIWIWNKNRFFERCLD